LPRTATHYILPALLLTSLATTPLVAQAVEEDLPPGVEQLLPRGRIAAVTEPEFVTAAEAEISDDAWVLGVAINGEAKAYSLNLLNRHEVVNDRFGDLPVAAVW
jgi:carotenoid cleavage dioxygenase-like enzyme